MAENSVVRARIDERTKNEATAVLAAMGLTVSCLSIADGASGEREGASVRAVKPQRQDDPRDQGGEEGETGGSPGAS